MIQEQQYQTVRFNNIVPVLDVGDPGAAYMRSVQAINRGMQGDMKQLIANQRLESELQKRKQDELEAFAKLSEKGAEEYTKFRNERLENELSEIWSQNFIEGVDVDEQKLYDDYDSEEQTQSETAETVGVGLTQNLTKGKTEPTVQEIATAGRIRNYSGIKGVVAANARAYAAMDSYGPALAKWLGQVKPEPGAGTQDAIREFNKRWSSATGLSSANPGFTAKHVYPKLRKEAAAENEAYTRGWNAGHAAEQKDMLQQQLAQGEIGLSTYFETMKGLTKADGKTLMNNDDVWSSLRGRFTPGQLATLGQQTFAVTGKPYASHPRWTQLMTEARSAQAQQYNLSRAEGQRQAQEGFQALGPNATREQLEAERNRLIAANIPLDIVDSQLTIARRSSTEATIVRQEADRVQRWADANPGKKIPLSVIGDAPLSVRQRFAGQMEPAAEAESVSELLRESQPFKDFSKDFKATVKGIVGTDMKIGSALTGTSDPANLNEFKSQALSDIVQRAQALMLGDASLTREQAFAKAKEDWIKDATAKQAAKELFDSKNNKFKISDLNQGGRQDLIGQVSELNKVKANNLKEGLSESDYAAPQKPGQYSERVKYLAGRFGITPKELVDLARNQAGLPELQNSPVDNTLQSVDKPTLAKIASLENPPVQLGLRAQINSGQTLTGTAQERTVAVGKQLLEMGYSGIWQHPDFNYDSGYTGTGTERVGSHAPNSYHNYNEALDIGVQANGPQKLEMLYQYLLKNKTRFGIAELFYDPDGSRGHPGGHTHHVHVAFGGGS